MCIQLFNIFHWVAIWSEINPNKQCILLQPIKPNFHWFTLLSPLLSDDKQHLQAKFLIPSDNDYDESNVDIEHDDDNDAGQNCIAWHRLPKSSDQVLSKWKLSIVWLVMMMKQM